MIEPFDAQRHAAVLQNQPIRTYGVTGPTHKADIVTTVDGAVCGQLGPVRVSEDWRLVNCPACRVQPQDDENVDYITAEAVHDGFEAKYLEEIRARRGLPKDTQAVRTYEREWDRFKYEWPKQ